MKRYEHKELALVNVRYKLASLDTSMGKGYKKMESLLQGINDARATLEAVGAEAELFNNVPVAQLVSKLSGSHQEMWHKDKTVSDFRNYQSKPGEKFLAWLERQGAAAVSARLTDHALALSKQPLSTRLGPRCGACGKGAHKTENGTGGEGKGKTCGLARDLGASLK